MNKLVVQEEFSNSLRVKSAELKDRYLFKGFMAFCVSLVCSLTLCQGNTESRKTLEIK